MPKTTLTSEGLKNSLKKYSLSESIIEYIWNGFDAEATIVAISEEKNVLGATSVVRIKDNGFGIRYDELENKFGPAYVSEKKNKTSDDSINIKGKKGVGRYSFYEEAISANWHTVYEENGKNKSYEITINASDIINYETTPTVQTTETTGTIVTLNTNKNANFNEIKEQIKIVFAWYLELYKNKSIIINGEVLDCSDILYSEEKRMFNNGELQAEITVCVWTRKLNEEYSKYYYIDDTDKVIYKENTTLNNKGDNFYHSVFIKSKLFSPKTFSFSTNMEDDNFIGLKGKKSKEFKQLKMACDMFLTEVRKPFIKEYASGFIGKLKEKGIYPEFDKNNPIDNFKEGQLDDVIANVYYFVPKVFTSLNKIQQKTLVRLFELIQDSGETNNIFKILGEVAELTAEERKDMADLLDKVELSNVLAMLKLVTDRLQAISDFKKLIVKERNATEVAHIQKFIEKHYWFFGEEYHLATAEEPNFEAALRTFLNHASDNYYQKGEVKIEDENKYKQMDIFAIQSIRSGDIKKCIVVELKRPSVVLGRDELNQLKKYYDVIKKDDRFNASNIEWEFYLVGNKYNHEIEEEIESNKNHGERSLAFRPSSGKIYVKTWSEIFVDLELNFNYLQEKLKFDYSKLSDKTIFSSDEIILSQEENTAVRPTALFDNDETA